jgi:hypothetical protein
MSQLFAVTRTRGSRWNYARTLEEQEAWESHAAFMNDLVDDGFVLLGGPLRNPRCPAHRSRLSSRPDQNAASR